MGEEDLIYCFTNFMSSTGKEKVNCKYCFTFAQITTHLLNIVSFKDCHGDPQTDDKLYGDKNAIFTNEYYIKM